MYGCATSKPVPAKQPDSLRGMASWYGEEFAGRTTANGEIFDPMQLTAAHRSLPFGTVLDVINPKTSQTVRVRVNDRGPYVGNRVLDLSYAAAQQIGLIEPGTGEVEMKVVTVGRGDREPPAPYVVGSDATAEKVVITSGEAPAVAFPLPSQTATPGAEADFRVAVVEERAGTPTRRQVGRDGKTIEDVPLAEGAAPVAASLDRQIVESRPRVAATPAKRTTQYVVQVGAFSVEANAKSLQERVARVGQKAYVDRERLFRVRIGPFGTRDEAVRVRSALESSGMSAMILTE
jgi:rare lipoprotein A